MLLIDEAQSMAPAVLAEIRTLSSAKFDAACYLTVILCGDDRMTSLLRQDDLVPPASRIRTRLVMEYASRDELLTLLEHVTRQAGNATLLTKPLMQTLADHAAGNCRMLLTMAGELLVEAMACEQTQLDEKLYLEVFQVPAAAGERKSKRHTVAQGRSAR